MSNIKRKTSALLAVLTICAALLSPAGAEQPRRELIPMGCAVGIQMSTDGALVVGLAATDNGAAPSPAAKAGIIPGDLITAVGGEKIGSAAELRVAVNKLAEDNITVSVKRGEENIELSLCPNRDSGGAELGMWLRDSVAGIGTLTYYDPQSGQYGGLGHGINDVDSGVLMPLGSGCILSSEITEVKKGCAGEPGELHGAFDPTAARGSICQNTCCGIFGALTGGVPSGEPIPVAHSDEIKLGSAKILSNTSGNRVEEYDVEITRVYRGDQPGRSMMISVCDPELLAITGGIVQGMSGSPIIQDGKLIGAVTHVMINDPTKGFGISIEEMLTASEGCLSPAA